MKHSLQSIAECGDGSSLKPELQKAVWAALTTEDSRAAKLLTFTRQFGQFRRSAYMTAARGPKQAAQSPRADHTTYERSRDWTQLWVSTAIHAD